MTTTKRPIARTTKPVTKPATDVATIPPATVPATIAPALTLADVSTVPDGFREPVYIGAFVNAFRAVASMPATTRDERVAVRDAFVATMDAAMPGTPMPTGRHTGRFSGCPVFESQNVLYVAAALANVALTDGHIMAAWRGELPNAKCDYLAKNYAWSTLSEYVNGRHNGSPIPGAVEIVIAWNKRGRKPVSA